VSWPAILLWALIGPIAFSSGPAVLYATLISVIFMSLQMLPVGGAGANLLPQTVFAAVLVGKVFLTRGNLVRAAEASIDPSRLGLFTAFLVFSIVTAIILPRAFAGLIEVIPVSGADLSGASLLAPRSGNITQSLYMLLSYCTALAFAVIGSRRDIRRHFLFALLAAGAALILSGVVDLVCYRAGLSAVLDPFRTASYTLLTDVEAAGAKRVVGFTPEASAYGGMCVNAAALILFLRPLYREGARRLAATFVLLGLLIMGALSTSATAYVGCGVLAVVYAFDLTRRFLDRNALGRDVLGWEIGLIGAGVLVILAVATLQPDRFAPLLDVFNTVILKKSGSYSYYQRSMWTRTAMEAFFDTGGLGAGLGSLRTSNWMVSILGSTGIFGSVLLFGFLIQRLLTSVRGLSREDAAFVFALKLSLMPYLVMNQLSGTIPDVGITAAITLGFLSSAPGETAHLPRTAKAFGPLARRGNVDGTRAVASS
jgi:hypothetical protein